MTRTQLIPPFALLYEEIVRRALLEDLGRAGDITTDAIVSPDEQGSAFIVARAEGRVAGLEVALSAFSSLDARVEIKRISVDGSDTGRGDHLAQIRGPVRAILSAERTALNFLGRLSGIATATREIVKAAAPFHAKVVCTRKTTPGLRSLEKYAVRAGGGANHRFGLDDAILIKDNHRIIAGGVTEAVRRVRNHIGHMVKIEVEVDTLGELEEALSLGVDAVLLDNMNEEQLSAAVHLVAGRALTEASGKITPENARSVAATGVDLLSLGWLTHSSPALDVSLDVNLRI
jgi:nicotinate-nucleotide pyrophosphorylase (carboxylating)